MTTLTLAAFAAPVLPETLTVTVPAEWAHDVLRLAPRCVYGERYARAVTDTLVDISHQCCNGLLERARQNLDWLLERYAPARGYAVLPGADLDEALALEFARTYGPVASVTLEECECGPGDHWSEDEFGRERRIDCGCACARCAEY